MNGNNGHKKIKRQRVIALLTREEMEFLDKLGKDSLFSTGSKLSRVEIISALIDAAMVLDVSADGIKNKEELIQRIIEALPYREERRKYPRLKKELSVKLRKMDSMEEHQEAVTKDTGLGGFSIGIDGKDAGFNVGDTVEIIISDKEARGEPIKAIGRVAWKSEAEDRQSYAIGVMLTYIRKEDEKDFLICLNNENENITDVNQNQEA